MCSVGVGGRKQTRSELFASGLGFAICCRLIDEFLHAHPRQENLTLIVTTRDATKGNDTLTRLNAHLRKSVSASKVALANTERVNLRFETVELTSLLSVRALEQKLLSDTPKLDAIILNAGYGAFTGINWPLAIWTILTDWVQAMTWPKYKLSGKGNLTDPQLSYMPSAFGSRRASYDDTNGMTVGSEPPLGAVFCSNVFGHYLLCHGLAPLLSNHPASDDARGRIIWVSSLEATSETFSCSDLQGIESPKSYESSKRLTDILALTSTLPSTSRWADHYLETLTSSKGTFTSTRKPKMYLTHPGICSTGIVALPLILYYLMTSAFYICRLLGSPWHTTRAYTGACAPVWVALSPQSQLDSLEKSQGPAKWGSATDTMGTERVLRTEVEGWGYGGKVGDEPGKRKGRRRGAKDLTQEAREDFEVLGRHCWERMEGLREEWERRLDGVEGTES
ncbi:MAG: 3-keto-steroid reductase [Candelina submexicana]|nr:MAG: 3-keto-steroid reductase [Candelina submexicana]